MRYGTPEQRRTHLPPIANGEVIGRQGFSEPNAGRTWRRRRPRSAGRGRLACDGSKVWTSYAGMAQWCFLLARTTKAEKKQQGITVFLVPMDDPAIEVRPIKSMIGPHHLNEVFIDNLWVTEADILGTLDEGWKLVQEVLAYERVGIARYARCERLLKAAPIVLGSQWDELPPELRSRWARMGVLPPRPAARLPRGRPPNSGRIRPADAAGYRIAVTRLDQESADVLMDIVGLARSIGGGRHALHSGRWRTTGATHKRPRWPRGASRCRGSCSPDNCCPRHEPRPERRGARVRPGLAAGARIGGG